MYGKVVNVSILYEIFTDYEHPGELIIFGDTVNLGNKLSPLYSDICCILTTSTLDSSVVLSNLFNSFCMSSNIVLPSKFLFKL